MESSRRAPRAGTPASPRKKLRALTELQLAILNVLWERGEATALQVHAELEPTTGLARGTIGTLLHRLERQRVLGHRREGRDYLYRAAVRREEVQAAQLGGVLHGVFDGSLAAIVTMAVSRREVTAEELARIRALLDAHAREKQR